MITDTSFLPKIATNPQYSPDSRLWIYIADRALTPGELEVAQSELRAFLNSWTAHDAQLKAEGEIFENQIILLMVDETQASASGCGIDKSVHFLENLSIKLGIDLFNRNIFAWICDNQITFESKYTFAQKRASGQISNESLVLNTLVEKKSDFDHKWLMPFGKSWMRRVLD